MIKLPWSYSSLSTFEKCPAQYKYRYLEKLPEGPPSEALLRGRTIHESLDRYLKGEIDLPGISRSFSQELIDMRESHKAISEERWDFSNKWKPAAREKSWVVMITDAHWTQVDLGWVVDFKTGRFYETHAYQAKLYGTGMLHKFSKLKRANVQFYYMDKSEIVEMEITRNELRSITKDFEARVAKIVGERKWNPKPSRLCAWCPYAKSVGGPCDEG